MPYRYTSRRSLLLFVVLAALVAVHPAAHGQVLTEAGAPAQPPVQPPAEDVRASVVKIHTTSRFPNLFQPWRKEGPQESSGTGAVIAGRRIITNAHVVRYASRVYVQGHQSADKVEATVVAYAPGVDLALLELEDDSFFDGRAPLTFADELPAIRSDVSAYGYPLGGEDLSVTKGIVSRIEVTGYSHGFLGLRIQVDAALNPGNSGGPALVDNQIVGIVFSGIGTADNIGYLIPTEEVLDFLEDAEDGTYDGRPGLQIGTLQTLENDALRDKLGLRRDQTGMLVNTIAPGITTPLRPWDVVTHIGEHDIDNQGNCPIRDDLRGDFRYFAHDLAGEDGTVPLTVIRDGETVVLQVPAYAPPVLMPSLAKYGDYPRYYIHGPLVFSQVTEELARALPTQYIQLFNLIDSPLATRIGEPPAFDGEELVVVAAPMFDHRIIKGYDSHHLAVVQAVNGTPVANLAALVTALNAVEDDFVVLTFAGTVSEMLVFDRRELTDSTEEILTDNGIRYQASRDLRGLLPDDE